jgi:hypothetical protein
MNRSVLMGVTLCLVAVVSCSRSKDNGAATGAVVGSKSFSGSPCPGGGQITMNLTQGQGILVPIYVGSDSRTYRISASGESASPAQTLQMEILLNGDTKAAVPFYAVVNNGSTNNSAMNSVDVEGQRIELTFSNVPGGYWNSLAEFCFYRVQ